MNCIKCNSVIPDGAKFCPNCGASYLKEADIAPSFTPETEKKYFCEKCGLEVAHGAKFCSVCGGAARAQDASSIENILGGTIGEGNMSAVSLDKPSGADELVSAMNSAASSVPTPVESGFNSGFTASAPSFAPSANAADMSGSSPVENLPNYNGGAAVAERPVKKKHKGRIALIIIGVVVALLGAVAIMFFTNRASVLSTVMGKSKYAAMVEGTHIKKVTDKIDIPAMADGIKSASTVFQVMSEMDPNMMGMTNNFYYSSNTAKTASMSYGYGGYGYGSEMEMDLSAIEKMYAEMLMSTYGKNSINGSIKANVKLGDSLRAMMEDSYYYSRQLEQIDEVLNYLNGTSITYNVSASDDAMAFSMGTEGKLTVNAKVLMSGQDMYVSLPFASDKAIKLTFDKPAEEYTDVEIKPLELEADELERIIADIIKIYLEHYKSLEIEMDEGEISAAGVSVEGKLITAEFSVEDLYEMIVDIAEYIADDDYLAQQIVEFANGCGYDIDEDDYADAIMDFIDEMDYDEDSKDKLIVETVINRNGDVLGKTYTVVVDKEKTTVSFAETKEQSGIEIKASDVKMSLLVEKENNENGTCTLKTTVDNKSVSLILKYSDAKKAEFCGKEIMTGKFDLSMKLPNEFKDQLDKDSYAAMNGAKLTLSIKSDSSNTIETSIAVKSNGYIDASVTETITVLDDTSDLNAPSNAIDLTPLTKNEYIDDQSAEDLIQLIKDAAKKLKDMGMDIDLDDVDEIDPAYFTGKVTRDQIDNLLGRINDRIDTFDYYIGYYGEYSYMSDYVEEYKTKKSKLVKLASKIAAKNYNITQDEYEAFYDEFYDYYY